MKLKEMQVAALSCLLFLIASSATAEPIASGVIQLSDGDTIARRGQTIRLVGFDAPERDGRSFVKEAQSVPPPATNLLIQANGCARGGCNSELCVSAAEANNIFTPCVERPEHACYRKASCEPQVTGKCGWTQTTELRQCLANLQKKNRPTTPQRSGSKPRKK